MSQQDSSPAKKRSECDSKVEDQANAKSQKAAAEVAAEDPKMRHTHLVVFHGKCHDGSLSSLIIERALNFNCDTLQWPCDVETLEEAIKDRSDVYLVDCIPAAKHFAGVPMSTTFHIFDHHDTALARGAEFFLFGFDAANINRYYDTKLATCELVWNHFHPNEPQPWGVKYIADRAMWRFALPNTHSVNAFIIANENAAGFTPLLTGTEPPAASRGIEWVNKMHGSEVFRRMLIACTDRLFRTDNYPIPVLAHLECPAFLAAEIGPALANKSKSGIALLCNYRIDADEWRISYFVDEKATISFHELVDSTKHPVGTEREGAFTVHNLGRILQRLEPDNSNCGTRCGLPFKTADQC